MGNPTIWAAVDHNAAYQALIEDTRIGITKVLPSDHWLICAVCPSCRAELALRGYAANIAGMTFSLPHMGAFLDDFIQRRLKKQPNPCPACGMSIADNDWTLAYASRIHAVTGAALFEFHQLPLPSPPVGQTLVFRPPDEWQDLGKLPSCAALVAAYGRVSHPATAVVEVLRSIAPENRRPVEWVTRDEVVTPFYSLDGAPDVEREWDGVRAAVLQAGLPGPHFFAATTFGARLNGFEEMGIGHVYAQLSGAKQAGIVFAFSWPRIGERINAIASQFGASLRETGKPTSVTVWKEGRQVTLDLADMLNRAAGSLLTFDEGFFDLAFAVLVGRRQDPPRPISDGPQSLRSDGPGPLPRIKAVAPHAGHGGEFMEMERGPWNRCRTCGNSAFLVRRAFDAVRFGRLYDPPPLVVEKGVTVRVGLFTRCDEHLHPVTASDITAWGVAQPFLLEQARNALALDALKVRRRVVEGPKGSPLLALAGPLAASIATDARWVEGAVRASGVLLGGPLKVEGHGENVITFRAKGSPPSGATAKELRRVTKSWGLPEPMICALWVQDFERAPTADGGVLIEGDV